MNRASSVLTLILIATAIWWMSAHAVWLGDDLDYQFRMKGEIWQSWGFINNPGDFTYSQIAHYLNVNGRFIAHVIVQLYCAVLGQQAFAVSNGIVYALFALLLAKAGGVRLCNPGGIVTASCLAVLCFVTKMMPTCQIGYIWGMAVNLAWLSRFFSQSRPSWWKTAWMGLAGIIVGNWQEALSIGVGAGLGIWWISQFFNRSATLHNFLDWRRSWMLTGYLAGTLSNIVSPANFERISSVSIPISHQWIITAYSLPAIWLLLMTLIYVSVRLRHVLGISFHQDGKIPTGVLWTGIIILTGFNFYIGVFSNRQWFGVNMFAIILILRLLPRHKFGRVVNSLLITAVVGLWIVMAEGMKEVKRQYDDIAHLHSISNDGSVEYDRTRVMTLGHPLSVKYYEDILGQFDNDLHHSMMKDFKHHRKGKTLKLKPTEVPDTVKVKKYAPGHFYVTVKEPEKNMPKCKVRVWGHYTICGIINFKTEPIDIEIEKYSRRRPPYSTAIIIPEVPMFVADSIALEP